jgi:hypothetical protein
MAALSRAVSLRVQAIIYYLTGSSDLASVGIFLLLLPGVFLHEGAHWLAAQLLGLRTGKFRVWPSKQGDYIGLGSVSVERADIWRESLVGVAPLVAGNLVLALIGWRVFTTPTLLAALVRGGVGGGDQQFLGRAAHLRWSGLGLCHFCRRQQHDAQRQRPRTLQAGIALHHLCRADLRDRRVAAGAGGAVARLDCAGNRDLGGGVDLPDLAGRAGVDGVMAAGVGAGTKDDKGERNGGMDTHGYFGRETACLARRRRRFDRRGGVGTGDKLDRPGAAAGAGARAATHNRGSGGGAAPLPRGASAGRRTAAARTWCMPRHTTPRDLLLSLERMAGVVAVDAQNQTLTVQAGAPLQRVQEAAAAHV